MAVAPSTRDIQLALLKEGISVGPAGADGVLGRNTITAIKQFQQSRHIDIDGVVGPETAKLLFGVVPTIIMPPWVSESHRYFGLNEVRDAKKLDDILDMDTSEIPWCGAYQAFLITQTLPNEPIPANPLWALNWQKFGVKDTEVTGRPHFGAIGVFKRKSGGHVGTIVAHNKTHVRVLGGNQSNSVSYTNIPKTNLVAYRWPSSVPFIGTPMGFSSLTGDVFDNKD